MKITLTIFCDKCQWECEYALEEISFYCYWDGEILLNTNCKHCNSILEKTLKEGTE